MSLCRACDDQTQTVYTEQKIKTYSSCPSRTLQWILKDTFTMKKQKTTYETINVSSFTNTLTRTYTNLLLPVTFRP